MDSKLRKKCSVCGKYLVAIGGEESPLWLHPATPCSGLTDAVRLIVEVEDEALQKIWVEKYNQPKYPDYELLNLIWNNRLLRWLVEGLIK